MFPFAPLRRIPFRISNISRTVRNASTATKPKGIKALTKAYGLPALGIYLGLSCIDLPICYIFVHSMGSEKIEIYENKVKNVFGYGVSEEEVLRRQESRVKEVVVEDKEQSLWKTVVNSFSWTEFAIAYGIHKSLIFIRLPITAAITPAVVRTLAGWGFNIGKGVVKTTSAGAAGTTVKAFDVTASNPKFGTRPTSKKKWWWFF
ncbi:uncharacterized protein SPAPADRAFT_60904 [Spathaspora passalidarum NRRL Y-27907]|uniref:DUF1279 domain-containing protein n=1 Tax=Spathaspora passalidarum (strain NRRL Y-27907 / 11-Y1) TaxID=619300 RepID=G3AKA7_SPAPN|nr:uncharacterized protein SPAPADRAFT_60904 [Spathaspora passalidarum NRRL Y-27907]EGW33566.1 hypothetical protein SPAPADRAFT_60904 [Spathaspora passalidarum NRRL Y-27907]